MSASARSMDQVHMHLSATGTGLEDRAGEPWSSYMTLPTRTHIHWPTATQAHVSTIVLVPDVFPNISRTPRRVVPRRPACPGLSAP